MRRTFFCSICVGLLLAVVLPSVSTVVAVETITKVQLLETGQFHGEEIKARTGERNVSRKMLFLSSQAGKGKLVKAIARFETAGF